MEISDHKRDSKQKRSRRRRDSDRMSYSSNLREISLHEKLCERLDLNHFKVKRCGQKVSHCYRKCFYYHNETDRRRDPRKFYYAPEFCDHMEYDGGCKLKDACGKSHSKAEQGYHPDKYRKKFCACYPDRLEECPYGKFCSYAHTENEIQTNMIHNYRRDDDFFLFYLKTQFCPYSSTHDRARCVYAHNWQDFRRDPSRFTYSAILCKNWDRTKKISSYDRGCPNSFDCLECHGRF